MRITDLRVNNIEHPLGFDVQPLSFSWVTENVKNAKHQKYARLRIYKENELVYDGGEDVTANSLDYQVSKEKLSLESRTRYKWSVEVAAEDGESAVGESWFETGKMTEGWTAKWITADMSADTPAILRKKFRASGRENARIYVTGLGIFELYLNGKKVGEEYLAPGYHSYDLHLQVQTYDLTGLLNKGENELQIWLGDGWFRGRLGFGEGSINLYGDRCYAICEVYENNELILKTDDTWQSGESPVVFSNIYDGEIYDSRKEVQDNDESCWKYKVREENPEKCKTAQMTDRYSLPVVIKEEIKPHLLVTPKEEQVLDFGQNMTGWTNFECELPEGFSIRLSASEILQNECFYRENLRTAKAEFTYISNGRRAFVRPHFTFYGFQYMKVEYMNPDGSLITGKELEKYQIQTEKFTGCHLRSDFDQTGWIHTGDAKVNQLFSNALWGQKDNFLDVPTDCPQRDERLGWTGDAQVFSETACYNMYVPAFFRKYMWDMRAEQELTEGAGMNVVPRMKEGLLAETGSCPWADAAVVIPWNVYRFFGNRTFLRECYPGMKAWVDYQKKREEVIGGDHLVKDGFHFADWLALDNPNPSPLPFGATDPLYIASAYYYYCADTVAKAAEILNIQEDKAEYQRLASQIKEAIQKKYFDENGVCTNRTQTGNALAIMFGLFPEEKSSVKVQGEILDELVQENGGHLNTGFVGTPFLCPALTEAGQNKTAVDLLLNEEYPGWLYCVNLGATTIWERWNSVEADGSINPEGMNSLNHYSYGSIEAWMYGYVCGIKPEEPGFKKVQIEPHPDQRLGFAELCLKTAAGTYEVSWKYQENGKVQYKFLIPFDCEADVVVGNQEVHLESGEYFYQV